MHRLFRPINEPTCLHSLRVQTPQAVWRDVSWAEKYQIRSKLFEMQGPFCAYCERVVTAEPEHEEKTGHVEHFRRRHDHPELTFDWNNLFYSCSENDSCGKHKDSNKIAGSFQYSDIVDPARENPEDFFYFDTNGGIHPRANLSCENKLRATETIRVFGLDSRRSERANIFKQYRYLQEVDRSSQIEILDSLVHSQPFLTMLYSVFGLRRV